MTPHQLRVVSYNVLSSSLSAPTFFAHSLEKHCSPRHRLEKLLTKLDAEVELGAVVCLQEVSLAWTGRLHAYFAAKRYTFVNSNYGNRNNNFMGVGVAFPSTRYALRMADLSVIADTKSGGWNAPRTAGAARPPAPAAPEPSWADALGSWFRRAVGQLPDCSPANRTSEASSDPAADEANEAWNLSKSKFNVMVSLRLRPLQDGEDDSREVVVATYHTPCVYWSPGAMTIHCALATQKVQTLAEGRFPYILTGDFNIKPGSPQYALLTTGVLPEKCADDSDPKVNGKPSFPSTPCFEGDKWAPTAFARGPMKSAYAEANGKEPRFTNYARTAGMEDTFAHTLDYVFFSDGLKFKGRTARLRVRGVRDLQDLCAAIAQNEKSLPSEAEPSDHLLIAADFDLVSEEAEKKLPADGAWVKVEQ